MRKISLVFLIVFFVTNSGSHLGAQMTISGIFDSTVSVNAGAGDSPGFSYGIEEFANIRFQTRIRERGRILGAVNLYAVAGDYAAAARANNPSGFIDAENYVAWIELERLHFRVNFEAADFDGGLMRIPFGFGQVWRPTDFLNPRNPLKPDARPRAVLGSTLAWYPGDEFKMLAFCAAPRNPYSQDGGGGLAGLAIDRHWGRASIQTLYSFEAPMRGSMQGIHRFGFSLKADVKVGFVVDALYVYNHENGTGLDGLSFSAGFDYSFFRGKLIVLAEYLYNGSASSTARGEGNIFGFSNEHYLYTGVTWRFSDFTNANIALVSGLSDISFTPMLGFNHELFQGATLMILAQVPIDRDLISGNGKRGELGPLPPDKLQPLLQEDGQRFGSYFFCTVRLRLRF
ncbi:MAG: hypothetical protein FWC36_04755 [Spirochaetes bacterium]|nr:hypothetical protein [Spirochaetota bacterium]